MKIKNFIFKFTEVFFLLSIALPCLAEEHDHSEDKSIEEFEISQKAELTLGIKTIEIKKLRKYLFEIPIQSIVYFAEDKGVYRFDGHHYQLIKIKVRKSYKSKVKIESKELKKGDKIVIQGVPLLRVVHLQESGEGGEGHAH